MGEENALAQQGAALLREGRFGEAAEALRQATALNPDDEGSWRLLGAALGQSGDLAGSVSAFQKTVALSPTSAKNHYNLALALQAGQRNSEARQHLEKSLALDPSYEQARLRLRELAAATTATTPTMAPMAATAPAPPPSAPSSFGGLSAIGGGTPEPISVPPPPPPPPVAAPPTFGGGQAQAGAYVPHNYGASSHQAEAIPAGRMALGVVLSLVFGILACAVWWGIIVATNFVIFGFAAIGVGWVMAKGMRLGCGQGGQTPATVAAVLAGLLLLPNLILMCLALQSPTSYIFSVLGLFWGIQQAYKTAGSLD